jgi:hypothetical protein
MDRRKFLRQMVAAPAIFGADAVFAQNPPAKPMWLSDAYAWMRKEEFRGIVIVVPDPAPDRAALGKALWQRLNHGGGAAHALFLQSFFIFIREPQAQQHLGRDLKAWDRVVLNPDGGALLRDRITLKTFQDQEKFESSMAPVIFGEDLRILIDRDEKAWSLAPADVRVALGQLGDEDILNRKRAMDLLQSRVYSVQPCLIRRAMETTKTEGREAAREIVEAYYRMRLGWSLDPMRVAGRRELRERTREPEFQQLPYGVALPGLVSGGCGISVEQPPEGEAMPQTDRDTVRRSSVMVCGMANVSTPSYSFVKFLVT